MARQVIHISDVEAASNFASLLERVQAGVEVVIEHDARPVAVALHPAAAPVRLLSESLRLAREHVPASTLDPDFAKDLAKPLLRVVAIRLTRQHGIDPRLQRRHRRGTPR